MPTPLSEKVSVFFSGSTAMVIANGPPPSISSGAGERLVTQLLAGVGGVGDEFADEDVAVGIDRMHHQVQQPRNVGLETLGLGGGVGLGGVCPPSNGRRSSKSPLCIMRNENPRRAIAPARLISRRKAEDFKRVGEARRAQKKADRLGGGPPIRRPAWQYSDPTRRSGAGGQKHRAPIEPNHRGSALNMDVALRRAH